MSDSPLISTAELADRLGEPGLIVLDASWYLPDQNRDPAAEFEAAHIPGAAPFDIDTIADTTSGYPHTLPSAELFAAAVAGLGVTNDHDIAVYDGLGFFSAPRVWWMFRAFGHDRVRVLDGGFPKWQAEGRPTEAGRPAHEAASRPFRAALRREMVRDLNEVRENLESGRDLVLDARGPGRFEGREAEPRPGVRAGHIPGSRNVHYAGLTNPQDGTFHGTDALAAIFAQAGVAPGRAIVCSCGSGVTACVLALGLHILGRDDVAIFDGSWSEWGTREDTPVETG